FFPDSVSLHPGYGGFPRCIRATLGYGTHTTPGLRPTPPHERRGKRLRSRDAERRGKRLRGRDAERRGKRLRGRDALPLLFSRRGVGEADGVVGVDLRLSSLHPGYHGLSPIAPGRCRAVRLVARVLLGRA